MEELDMFGNEFEDCFKLINLERKTIFEFEVDRCEKKRFLHLVRSLSSVEFKVNVDLDNIWIEEYSVASVIRVKASGEKQNLEIWSNMLKVAAESLRGNTSVFHFKNANKQ